MRRALLAGVAYFAVVFAAGFVLGVVRETWVVGPLGRQTAELLEMPLMFGAMLVGARWAVRRFVPPRDAGSRWAMGLLALALLQAFEFGVVMPLRGMSFDAYLASRLTPAGIAYLLMVALYAALPWLLARRGL
jgi:hypothetical protein